VVILTPMPTSAQMKMLKIRHICHLPRLILIEKGWQVLVAARDEEIEEEIEEEGDADDEEEEETFEVEEINPTSYIHMGTPIFRLPLNLD
jgi:hypothetical protein